MVTVYGIKQCNTMKKALHWLDEHGVAHRFHDYRKDGIDPQRLRTWVEELGWEALVNRRGTTWRKLPEEERAAMDPERAIAVMMERPAIIKRPLLDLGERRILGFSEDTYSALFSSPAGVDCEARA